jgi:hypothetical protein
MGILTPRKPLTFRHFLTLLIMGDNKPAVLAQTNSHQQPNKAEDTHSHKEGTYVEGDGKE